MVELPKDKRLECITEKEFEVYHQIKTAELNQKDLQKEEWWISTYADLYGLTTVAATAGIFLAPSFVPVLCGVLGLYSGIVTYKNYRNAERKRKEVRESKEKIQSLKSTMEYRNMQEKLSMFLHF